MNDRIESAAHGSASDSWHLVSEEEKAACLDNARFFFDAYRTLSAEQWEREREAISRTVDPLAWRNVDHFMADGKDLRFCWPWIRTSLRRADDVLWLLGFTRAEAGRRRLFGEFAGRG